MILAFLRFLGKILEKIGDPSRQKIFFEILFPAHRESRANTYCGEFLAL